MIEPPAPSVRGVSAVLCAVVGGIVVLPALYVLSLAFSGDDGFSLRAFESVLASERQWGLLLNSLLVAGGVALVATAVGVPHGLILDYVRLRGRALWLSLTIVPLILPPYIIAVAYVDLFGTSGIVAQLMTTMLGGTSPVGNPYNLAGVILVMAFMYYPIVVLGVVAGLRRIDGGLIEAARVCVGEWRIVAGLLLPLLGPYVVVCAVFVFLLSLLNFTVPSLLQVGIYPVEIYVQFNVSYDAGAAAAQALPLVGIGGMALLVAGCMFRRLPIKNEAELRAITPPVIGKSVGALAIFSGVVILLSVVMPIGVIAFRSLPLDTYAEAWQTGKEELFTSVATAFVGATVMTIIAVVMAHAIHTGGWGRNVGRLSFLPFLLSGPVIAIALINLWNRPGPAGWVYDSVAIVILAYMARFFAFVYLGAAVAVSRASGPMEEAAVMSGVGPWQRLVGIVLPYRAPFFVGLWCFAFIYCFGEVGATVLVCPPGYTTLPVRLHSLLHYGPTNLTSALSLVSTAVVIAVGAAGFAMANAWKARRHV